MHVSEAVAARRSIRRFLPAPVDDALIRKLLAGASRAPSGGNLQPWSVVIITGETMPKFLEHIRATGLQSEPGYDIYPPKLKSPYRDSRFKVGEDMYDLLGIARDDRAGRLANMALNFEFFGAPVGLFCFVDRVMGPPQWSDLGMFLQTFMLLATEAGLDTCAQEAWTIHSEAVRSFVHPPDEHMLFCGMAIGHRDPNEPVNDLITDRRPIDEWTVFL